MKNDVDVVLTKCLQPICKPFAKFQGSKAVSTTRHAISSYPGGCFWELGIISMALSITLPCISIWPQNSLIQWFFCWLVYQWMILPTAGTTVQKRVVQPNCSRQGRQQQQQQHHQHTTLLTFMSFVNTFAFTFFSPSHLPTLATLPWLCSLTLASLNAA